MWEICYHRGQCPKSIGELYWKKKYSFKILFKIIEILENDYFEFKIFWKKYKRKCIGFIYYFSIKKYKKWKLHPNKHLWYKYSKLYQSDNFGKKVL